MIGEGISKEKCLLAIELYDVSDKYIYNLREKQQHRRDVFAYLPFYTVNTNKGQHNQPMIADCFLQWAGNFKDHNEIIYLMFNAHTLDRQLEEEISNAGIEDLFQKLDFVKILSNFVPQSEDDFSKGVFPRVNYLIVEITYDVSYDDYNGGYDCDTDVDIIGYLDNQLQAKYFENK
jgi:hypothetical protein